MNILKIAWCAASLLLLTHCRPHENVGYYPTGNVKYRVPLNEKGRYSGELTHYYPNGTLKSVIPFQNGDVTGLVRSYAPTGKLVTTSFWKNNEKTGQMREYFPTGKLSFKSTMLNNKRIDTAYWYYPTGKLKSLIVYDAGGKKTDFGAWKPDGSKDVQYIYPLFLSRADTLVLGQDYIFKIVLGNRRSTAIRVKILLPTARLDSAVGEKSTTQYILRRPSLGEHLVRAKVYERWQHSDTLWTNWYGVEHRFYVKARL